MSRMSKVFWGEGLFLRPQHFQRQDAYHEARLQDVAAAVHPYAWGVRQVRFDLQSLASGTLRVLQLSAIFPDGEMVAAPDDDELPGALSLSGLPAGITSTTIHLALPLLRDFGGNCGATDGGGATRYSQTNRATPDLYTDAGEAELSYLHKTVRLLTDDEPRDPFVTLPIARVRRTATGGFELDDSFLAPGMSLTGRRLMY